MSVVANVVINVDTTGALASIKKLEAAAKGAGADLGNNLKGAAAGATGLGAALQSAVAPLLAITTAAAAVKQSLDTAFARGAAEQRLQNLTSSTGEYKAALAAASTASQQFGMSQTKATQAFADAYGRLNSLGYGLKQVNEVYVGFNNAAKQAGVSSEDAAGAFLQLTQGMGAGVLNGENLATILERMPQLGKLLADSMGVSAGQIKQLGADGKITGDVIYKALSQSAKASGDFSNTLTEQQKTFNALGQVTDRLLNSIGQVFAPFVIAGAKVLVEYGKALGDYWDYLGGVVFPEVLKTLQPVIVEIKKLASQVDWKALIGLIQGALITAINGFVLALRLVTPIVTTILKALNALVSQVDWKGLTGLIQGALVVGMKNFVSVLRLVTPIVTIILQGFNALAKNPAFIFVAQQIQNITKLLGISSTAVSDFKAKQDATKQGAADTVNNYSSLPAKINEAKAAQDGMKESIQASLTGINDAKVAIQAQIASLEHGASITAARYNAEKAFNDLQGQQLQRSYELATSAEQRFKIAIAIFNQQVAAANIERNQALENINLEQRKLELKLEEAKITRLDIQQKGQLAIIEAKTTEDAKKKKIEMDAALGTNKQLIGAISDQLGTQQQIAQYQKQAVDAQYQGKVLAAQIALEQKLVSDKIGLSQADALRLSNNLAAATGPSQRLAGDTGKISTNASSASGNFISLAGSAQQAANSINAAANAQARLNALRSSGGGGGGGTTSVQTAATGAYWPGGFQAFAKGGMVTKPTLGLIGEGGQPEYIVPQSKASNFARNVLSGRTGAAAINSSSSGSGGGGTATQVSIQTGPVVQMNGTNYVTTQQMSMAVKEGIDQAMRFMSRDLGIRRSMGMA